MIKSSIGIQNDAEVIRYLIQYYYQKKFEIKAVSKKEEIELYQYEVSFYSFIYVN